MRGYLTSETLKVSQYLSDCGSIVSIRELMIKEKVRIEFVHVEIRDDLVTN